MACRFCGSENLQKVTGELTFSLPDLKDAKIPPVYVCQEFSVCLDCGLAELRIPSDKLDPLRKRND